jgi:23S rRNA pseudouridine2605 synthase
VLAHAGLGSRRSCEDLIRQGRVSVDGQVIRELGTRVNPDQARITVDGEAIRRESMVYYAVNKPKGYVSTSADPAGRPRVIDLLAEIPERVYTVGRLDEESTGLMILTNDGELANRLAHPRYGVEKVYRALIAGAPDQEVLAKLTAGVWLSDGKIRAKRARLVGRQGQANVLELVLAEGKNREVRRMLAKLGHKVMSLNRVAVGPVSVKGLASGACRPLSRHEVDLLWKVANGAAVSLPRFLDGESSPRNRRDSRQKPQAGDGRSRRDRTGSPRRRDGDSSHHSGPASSSKQIRPTMPSHATRSELPKPPPPDSTPRKTRSSHEPPARKPPHNERSGPRQSKGPPMPKHAPAHSERSATPAPTRHIIGLESQSPTVPSSHLQRQRSRKRPPPRSRRPSPTPPVKRRTLPFRPPGTAGEDA